MSTGFKWALLLIITILAVVGASYYLGVAMSTLEEVKYKQSREAYIKVVAALKNKQATYLSDIAVLQGKQIRKREEITKLKDGLARLRRIADEAIPAKEYTRSKEDLLHETATASLDSLLINFTGYASAGERLRGGNK